MKLTLSPTTTFAKVQTNGALHCRIWSGTTDRGTEVHVLIAGVAVPEEQVVDEELKQLIEIFPVQMWDDVEKPRPPIDPSQRGGMHGHRN
jgi:hypothetical protein